MTRLDAVVHMLLTAQARDLPRDLRPDDVCDLGASDEGLRRHTGIMPSRIVICGRLTTPLLTIGIINPCLITTGSRISAVVELMAFVSRVG